MSFGIVIEGRELNEVDLLRMEVRASRRATTFLKNAIGQQAMLDIMTSTVAPTEAAWKEWMSASNGAFSAHSMTFVVKGLSADRFWNYIMANAGEVLQFRMHPEHYVSQFANGTNGALIIAETWGSAVILSHGQFCDPAALKEEGIDIDEVWTPAAKYRVAAIGRWQSGLFLAAVLHQLTSHNDGFSFKTCAFLPAAVPKEVIEGMDEHAAVEFSNMIHIANTEAA